MNKYYVVVSETVNGKFKGQKHYYIKGGYVRPYGFQLTPSQCYNNKKTAERIAKKYAEDEFFKDMTYTVEEISL